MRPVSNNIDKVQVLHIGNLPIRPHTNNIPQLQLHNLLTLFFQMPINHLPNRLFIKYKQQRIRIIIQPNLNTNFLEQEPIPENELDFPVGELDDLVVWAVDQGVEFYLLL